MHSSMSSLVLIALCILDVAEAAAVTRLQRGQYKQQAPGDSRSPCPALNTLANHGVLPRNGKSITPDQLTTAVQNTYNLDGLFSYLLGHGSLPLVANDTISALTKETINLSDLNLHDAIEHDASLTRNDFAQGDNHSFQPTLLAALLTDTDNDNISIQSLAKTRVRREKDILLRGLPQPGLKTNSLAYGEAALLLQVLSKSANVSEPLAPKKDVQTWFAEERLPDGWQKPAQKITLVSTSGIAGRIQELADSLKRLPARN